MTKEEKRDKRMKDYLEGTGIKFCDAGAEKLYKERVTRQMKVSRLLVLALSELPNRHKVTRTRYLIQNKRN